MVSDADMWYVKRSLVDLPSTHVSTHRPAKIALPCAFLWSHCEACAPGVFWRVFLATDRFTESEMEARLWVTCAQTITAYWHRIRFHRSFGMSCALPSHFVPSITRAHAIVSINRVFN